MAASVSITTGPEVPGSRPTGGEAVTLAQLGLSRLDYLIVTAVDGNIPAWDGSTSSPKIKLFWVDTTTDGAPMAEVASTTDVSSTTARFLAIGA
jgi:hypothetical protein